jgi:hypothetical protein
MYHDAPESAPTYPITILDNYPRLDVTWGCQFVRSSVLLTLFILVAGAVTVVPDVYTGLPIGKVDVLQAGGASWFHVAMTTAVSW